MFKFLFKSKYLGFVEAPVGVFWFPFGPEDWIYLNALDVFVVDGILLSYLYKGK